MYQREAQLEETIQVFFDGACKDDAASYGVVIRRNGQILWKTSEHVPGLGTANLAEYAGFVSALRWLLENGMHREQIRVYGDAKLVIEQQFGKWRIKKGVYAPLAYQARDLVRQFSDITGEWIPRERNAVADRLSRRRHKIGGHPMATIMLFPSVKRSGTIRKWAEELYWHRDRARTNILGSRLRTYLASRLKLGIDEVTAAADTKALEVAIRREIARLEAISGRVA